MSKVTLRLECQIDTEIIDTLRARVARLEEALMIYRHEQCEGFCAEHENWFGDCAGCIARAALSAETP